MILDIVYELKNQKAVIKEIRRSQSGMLRNQSITSSVASNTNPASSANYNTTSSNGATNVVNPAMDYNNGNQPKNNTPYQPLPKGPSGYATGLNMYPDDVSVKKTPREKEKRHSSSSASAEKHHQKPPANWTANMYPFQNSKEIHE